MKKMFYFTLFIFTLTLSAMESVIWDKTNNFEGWKQFLFAKGELIAGNLVLTEIKFDCRMQNTKITLDPEKYNAFTFRYRAEGTGKGGGQLFFAHGTEHFSDSRKWNTPPLKADGQWHTVTVRPVKLDSWLKGGTVTALRFDPTDSAGGKIEIAEMRFEFKYSPVPITQKSENAKPPKREKVTLWNATNQFAGWEYSYHTKKEIMDGNLLLTITGADPRLINDLVLIDPVESNCFIFRYRAEGIGKDGGQLYYGRGKQSFSDLRKWRIPTLKADGQWHTVTLTEKDLTDTSSWYDGGPITALRFDPTDSAGGRIEISELRFEKRPRLPSFPKVAVKLDAPEWPVVKSELWQKTMDSAPYFNGKMIRSPKDLREGSKHHNFFIRREFTLKAKPVQGWLQFTADDCTQAFVNGKNVSYANDWRSTVTAKVTDILDAGKNVLAFHYLNSFSFGGVLAELYIQYADGSFERIDTDRSFACSVEERPGWNTIAFDASEWEAAVEQPAPPAPPWKLKLPYRYFNNMQKIITASVEPKKTEAGKVVHFDLKCEGKMPDTAIRATIVFTAGKKLIWRENLILGKQYFTAIDSKHWKLEFPYTTPLYLNTNKLNISLESDVLACQSEALLNLNLELTRIKNDSRYVQKPIFVLEKSAYGPSFALNGNSFYPVWYSREVPRKQPFVDFNLVTVRANYEKWWPKCGEFDPSVFDFVAEEYRRHYPNAYFMWNFTLSLPYDWVDKYPKEMCLDEKGNVNKGGFPNFSFASKQALQDMEEVLLKAIDYLEKSPYANRIVGYRICGGHTIEWLGWDSSGGGALDFSSCAKTAFRKFIQKHYPELKDYEVPTLADRKTLDDGALLWNPQKHLDSIAYHDFYSNTVADMLIHLCSKVKNKVNHQKAVGTYYGYTATLHHTGHSQMRAHYALKKVLDSGCVDFLISPQSYQLRNIGDTCGEMKPFKSLQFNNIIPVIEDDTRTHNGFDVMRTAGSSSQTVTEQQSLAVMRRNMGIAICRNEPIYYCPLANGTDFDFPAMAHDIALLHKVGEHCLTKKVQRNAEIALVFSEKTITSMPMLPGKTVASTEYQQLYQADGSVKKIPIVKTVLTWESFIGNQGRFARAGAPTDYLLAEDLKDHPGNYKLYVFINCFRYDGEFLEAIEALRKRNCMLLWIYAPGYTLNGINSTENMKRLTGIDFAEMDGPLIPAVRLADGRLMGTTTTRIKPMFSVMNKDAEVLGIYEDGTTGVAAVKTGEALSVFSGVWQLDVTFLIALLERAGVHLYSESADPLEANESLVVLHARFPGRKTIRLPQKTNVLDIYQRKIVGHETDVVAWDAPLHETKFFYYGDDAEILLKKLNQIR